ncbi:MAG: AbrB/MazE/SpoVT family DNA-binding domain-containing protein [Ideonella sp.]|nr:AbrB/MazE/SpoVT family DNA-binding domain-containing protein [Ideonella sp.]MCC7457140.1 hypothetical protein [Nitrospira sp.]
MPIAQYARHTYNLPKEFRFEGTEVHVRRVGNEVVLSAVAPPSVDALIDALMVFEPGAAIERRQPTEPQRRPSIRSAR